MKIIFSILFILSTLLVHAQICHDDTHSTNVFDSWVSCQTAQNPNPARGNSHWVMYDLGYVYSLGVTYLWNYNVMGQTDRGMKNLVIDYSLDGITWNQIVTYQLSQATGLPTYIGSFGPDLNGIDARYVLITAIDTWGSTGCAGLSEIKFNIDGLVENEVLTEHALSLDLYPNPADQFLNIASGYDLKEVILLNSAGTELTRFAYRERIDVSYLPAGAYLIKGLTADGELAVGRFVKL